MLMCWYAVAAHRTVWCEMKNQLACYTMQYHDHAYAWKMSHVPLYVAGTANGRARWVDLEKGLLKADVYCRPLGKSAVRALPLHNKWLNITCGELMSHTHLDNTKQAHIHLPCRSLPSMVATFLIYGVILSTSKENKYLLLIGNISMLGLLSLFLTLVMLIKSPLSHSLIFYNSHSCPKHPCALGAQ